MNEVIKKVSTKNGIFANEFLGEYLSRSFGTMSKRDIDTNKTENVAVFKGGEKVNRK